MTHFYSWFLVVALLLGSKFVRTHIPGVLCASHDLNCPPKYFACVGRLLLFVSHSYAFQVGDGDHRGSMCLPMC